MTTNTLLTVNATLIFLVVGGLFALVVRVHRALASDSTAASGWGLAQQGVPSDPLPLDAMLDRERELSRAA